MTNNLIDILEQETDLYEEVMTLLQEEKIILGKRESETLLEHARKMESAAFKGRCLETLRNEIVDTLVETFGIKQTVKKDINLSKIIEHVNDPDRTKLKELQTSLLALVDGIEMLNQENSLVIDKGLGNIKDAFEFLSEISTADTYKENGDIYTGLKNRG